LLKGTNIVVQFYFGVLQSAPELNGPWKDVTNASNPYIQEVTGRKQEFFRTPLLPDNQHQQLRTVKGVTHDQADRNPFQRNSRFRPQSLRDPDLLRISLETLPQLTTLPSQAFEFLLHDPLGFARRLPGARGHNIGT
jgi:hypothetical protein